MRRAHVQDIGSDVGGNQLLVRHTKSDNLAKARKHAWFIDASKHIDDALNDPVKEPHNRRKLCQFV